jgi:hypothetical protein
MTRSGVTREVACASGTRRRATASPYDRERTNAVERTTCGARFVAMSADEDETLRLARALPVRDRVAHAHWKARVECYDAIAQRCARARAMEDDADVVAFGACAMRRRWARERARRRCRGSDEARRGI